MASLPPEATMIDPHLSEVGAGVPYQKLVYGRIYEELVCAVLVAELVMAHPGGEGVVGRFYGTRLNGILLGEVFRPWSSEGLGEVRWDPELLEWRPVGA